MKSEFKQAADRIALEEGAELAPLFGSDGLVTAVVSDADSGTLLMVAHMNADALAKTLETGEAWYWSRSRGELWHKGATSGTEQEVVEIRVDCDQDAVWLMVRPRKAEGTCHTGRTTCFYRRVEKDANGKARLRFAEHRPSEPR